MINRKQVLDLLYYQPIEIGHWVGFKDLTEVHNKWLRSFLYNDQDQTLQGHRGSFKTTTLSLFFAIHSIINPNETVLFFRKTGSDVAEVLRQTSNIMNSGCMQEITRILYGKDLKLIKSSNTEIQTNLSTNIKGSSQIVGLGLFTSITGKHADIIVTDDIVNVNDRVSRAERDRTKRSYMELQNIKNRGGRFINTGTPWHKDDAFTLMPAPAKFDCYSTGLMSENQIDFIKQRMSPSLFAANYELKHIASEDVIFIDAKVGGDPKFVMDGVAHVDSAFYGEDYTAFSIMNYVDGKYYLYGKMWRKHVEDCYPKILEDYNKFLCRKLFMELNADKGMVAKELKMAGIRTATYHESMNKHVKIVTYLKSIWPDLVFVDGTDPEYIEQITDYTENAAHDDAPDSASCLARIMYRKGKRRDTGENNNDYISGLS